MDRDGRPVADDAPVPDGGALRVSAFAMDGAGRADDAAAGAQAAMDHLNSTAEGRRALAADAAAASLADMRAALAQAEHAKRDTNTVRGRYCAHLANAWKGAGR